MKKNPCLRIFAALVALLLFLLCFAACGAASSYKNDAGKDSVSASPEKGDGLGATDAPTLGTVTDRKIIKTFSLSAETKEFDAATTSLNTLITQNGGYVESMSSNNQSLNGSGHFERYASYTIRIPAEKADAFVSAVGGLFNLTSNRAEVEDISESYYSIEAKLEELQVERASLLDILESTETKADYSLWLTVHQRLSEVTQQIAVYQGQINRYDSEVTYSTVYLTLDEVLSYSDTDEDSFWTRLGNSFVGGWQDFLSGVQAFCIWFVGAIPAFLVIALIATGTVLIVKRVRRSKK